MLGGLDRKISFICTSGGTDINSCIEQKAGRIEYLAVDVPGAGTP